MWRFLKKLEIELQYDPVIPLLGIYTEETRIERDTCTPMFITALFIIARTWRQPRCPSADDWIRKLWYIYTMEYYSAIKKNAFESVLMSFMKLEPFIHNSCGFTDICIIHYLSLKIFQMQLSQLKEGNMPIIQSEVSQKEKHQYSILMHIYGI